MAHYDGPLWLARAVGRDVAPPCEFVVAARSKRTSCRCRSTRDARDLSTCCDVQTSCGGFGTSSVDAFVGDRCAMHLAVVAWTVHAPKARSLPSRQNPACRRTATPARKDTHTHARIACNELCGWQINAHAMNWNVGLRSYNIASFLSLKAAINIRLNAYLIFHFGLPWFSVGCRVEVSGCVLQHTVVAASEMPRLATPFVDSAHRSPRKPEWRRAVLCREPMLCYIWLVNSWSVHLRIWNASQNVLEKLESRDYNLLTMDKCI